MRRSAGNWELRHRLRNLESEHGIPKLRFKEFQGQWKYKKIAEILQKVSRPVDVELTRMYQQIGIRSHGKGLFHKDPVSGASLGNKRIFWLDENLFVLNIVFAWEQAVAKTTSFEKGMVASHRFPMYKPKENLSDIDYIVYFFLTDKGKNYLELASPGGAGRNKTLGQKNFEELIVIVPNIDEQTKIANFLTVIDEKVTQLTQKCDLLTQYKKGVMQQIFSQKLRFKDDEDSELRTGKLKDFGFFYYGKSVPKDSISNDAKTPCVRYGELYSTYRECIKNIKSYTNICPDNLKFSKGGEVLIPRVGEDPMDFANCCYLPIANVAIGEMISVYNTKENGLFITYYINSMLKKQLAKFVEGGSVSNLYFSYLEDIEITIPSLEKQTKIASFLTTIDDKITQTQSQLEAVKHYKKGLLQQLFV